MSRKKRNQAFDMSDNYFQSASFNQIAFSLYRTWIQSLAMNRFRWVGLPDTCDQRFLEWTLMTQGEATICQAPKYPRLWVSTQLSENGPINIYDNPTKWRSFGNNGWNFRVTPKNGVLVYDNQIRIPTTIYLDYFARRLAAVDRTLDINLNAQKTPYIVTCPQAQRNDLLQLIKQVQGGEPVIAGTKSLSDLVDDFKVLNLQVPFIGEELNSTQLNIWNQVYAFLGITSLPRKTERMIEDEVTANNDPTSLMKLNAIDARREAAEKLNKRFGLDVEVVWNDDFISDNFKTSHKLEVALEALGGDEVDELE